MPVSSYTYDQCAATYVGGPGAYGDRHTHAMSMLAEQQVANMLALEWDLLTKPTPDPGWDMKMGDITIDVKWSDKQDRDGITHLPVKVEKHRCDIYVLVYGKDPDHLRVLGFISGRRAERYATVTDPDGPRAGLTSYWVPETALTPMVDIYDKLQAAWPERFGAYIEQAYPRSAWETGEELDSHPSDQPLPTLHPHRG